jgi:hypothetical protein
LQQSLRRIINPILAAVAEEGSEGRYLQQLLRKAEYRMGILVITVPIPYR